MGGVLIAPNVRAAMVVAALYGALAGGAGYVVAFLYTWPVGASQAAFAAALVLLSALARGIKERWAKANHGRHA
jgi:ABC-type Mn2+/Zn2+ transport system permease subunit